MMAPALLHAAMLGMATLGFLSLALGMEDHAEEVLGRVPPRSIRWLARLAGWLGLIAALAIGVSGFGGGMGPVWALGWASVAALSVVFGLEKWGSRNGVARPAMVRRAAAADPLPVPAHRGCRLFAMLCLAATVGGYGVMLCRAQS